MCWTAWCSTARRHDLVAARPTGPRGALQREVVGLRAAGREDDLAGLGVERVGEPLVRLVERGAARRPYQCADDGLPKSSVKYGSIASSDLAPDGRRGGMVEVDRHGRDCTRGRAAGPARARVAPSVACVWEPVVPTRFTPEFALALPVVSDAQLSPDGDLVAFVAADQSRPGGPKRPAFAPSAVYAVPAGGGETRRLTYGRADSTPRWSPDGRTLAFLSDREKDGLRQVHLLPRDGGEARQLTHLESDIPVGRSFNPLAWFPDGSRLVFPLIDPLDGLDARRAGSMRATTGSCSRRSRGTGACGRSTPRPA